MQHAALLSMWSSSALVCESLRCGKWEEQNAARLGLIPGGRRFLVPETLARSAAILCPHFAHTLPTICPKQAKFGPGWTHHKTAKNRENKRNTAKSRRTKKVPLVGFEPTLRASGNRENKRNTRPRTRCLPTFCPQNSENTGESRLPQLCVTRITQSTRHTVEIVIKKHAVSVQSDRRR